MITMNKAKAMLKQILPPVIIAAVRRARAVPSFAVRRYPLSKSVSVVGQAKQHLEQANHIPEMGSMPTNEKWTAALARMSKDISRLVTTRDVIFHGQSGIGFDHRAPSVGLLPLFNINQATLKSEFPHFSSQIDEMGESPYSRSETLLVYGGRLVSNVFFFHLRYVLQYLTHISEPSIVCEIGGGTAVQRGCG